MTARQDQQRFFEALALLRLCRSGSGPRIKARELLSDGQRESNLWHQVLDELTWLADTEPAGRTVTSIAAVNFNNEGVLLVAANNEIPPSTHQHLTDVLGVLQRCSGLDEEGRARLADQIFSDSVQHSWRKVVNYQKQLRRCVAKAFVPSQGVDEPEHHPVPHSSAQQTLTKSEEELQRILSNMEDFGEERDGLCRFAYHLRKHSCMATLEHLCDSGDRPIWGSIRHLIGRLGAWCRSARTLVRIAGTEPHLLSGLRICLLRTKVLPFSQPTIDESSFERALSAAWLNFDLGRVRSALQQTQRCSLDALRAKFEAILKDTNLKPFVHAEVRLADHIFTHRLSFVRDDRYIGCSKPSCYNCQLYLELHPSQLCRRPSHGNLWLKWSPSAAGLDTHYGDVLLQEMIRRIHRDTVATLFTQQSVGRFPDSFTGLSQSLITTA